MEPVCLVTMITLSPAPVLTPSLETSVTSVQVSAVEWDTVSWITMVSPHVSVHLESSVLTAGPVKMRAVRGLSVNTMGPATSADHPLVSCSHSATAEMSSMMEDCVRQTSVSQSTARMEAEASDWTQVSVSAHVTLHGQVPGVRTG